MIITNDTARRLSAGLVHLADRDASGVVVGYAGWESGPFPRRLMEAMKTAIPFPADLRGVLAEREAWRALGRKWVAIDPRHGRIHSIRVRIAALSYLMGHRPARSIEDIMARLDWLSLKIEASCGFDFNQRLSLVSRLRSDFERLSEHQAKARVARRLQSDSTENGSLHGTARSNADKQQAVLQFLTADADFSNRAIARHCGVSAPMVGIWRSRLARQQ